MELPLKRLGFQFPLASNATEFRYRMTDLYCLAKGKTKAQDSTTNNNGPLVRFSALSRVLVDV